MVEPENQIFLAIFTLLVTSSPLFPTKEMSNLFFLRGSWISPATISGAPEMPGISTSVPYLSSRSSATMLPTPSGGPSSWTAL